MFYVLLRGGRKGIYKSLEEAQKRVSKKYRYAKSYWIKSFSYLSDAREALKEQKYKNRLHSSGQRRRPLKKKKKTRLG